MKMCSNLQLSIYHVACSIDVDKNSRKEGKYISEHIRHIQSNISQGHELTGSPLSTVDKLRQLIKKFQEVDNNFHLQLTNNFSIKPRLPFTKGIILIF